TWYASALCARAEAATHSRARVTRTDRVRTSRLSVPRQACDTALNLSKLELWHAARQHEDPPPCCRRHDDQAAKHHDRGAYRQHVPLDVEIGVCVDGEWPEVV